MCVSFLLPSTVWPPSQPMLGEPRNGQEAWVRLARSNPVPKCCEWKLKPGKRQGELEVERQGRSFPGMEKPETSLVALGWLLSSSGNSPLDATLKTHVQFPALPL